MQRVRRAGSTALTFVLALGWSGIPAVGGPWSAAVADAASIAWPTSTLVISEVQTGGAGASDEFVEIANQGTAPVDLVGLEVVYATSSGSTVTRKATWADSLILTAGRRVLVVNGAGALVGLGDLAY
ncbi:MAG: lamin tail domain-containing protein, partial [Candidatus Limnocylindrales bacterium]